MLANYLSAEGLIIARLKARLPAVRAVLSAADLVGVEERSQITPALHVLYDGDTVQESPGRAQSVGQRWLVIVAVRNVRDQMGGSAARADAGALLTQVIQALQYWAPSPQHGKLMRANAPKAHQGEYSYFPLAFVTDIVSAGDPQP